MNTLKSAVYVGNIRHRRFVPRGNEFNYPIFMLYLDLDELDELFAKKWYASVDTSNLLCFRRSDFFAPEEPSLKRAVIRAVKKS